MNTDSQHKYNPLHVYCRLRDCHVPKSIAKRVCRWYENHIWCHIGTKATAH